MRLRCIGRMAAHWGSIFEIGNEYDVVDIVNRSVTIITNYESYWEKMKLIASSRDLVKEEIPGYISMGEIERLYTKKLDLPHALIKGDDNQTHHFCLSSYEEFYQMGASVKVSGRPAFQYTVYLIDEYFDYTVERRERKLLEIGI